MSKSAPDLAVLSIGYQHFLLPMDKALTVLRAMKGAIDIDYDRERGDGSTTRWVATSDIPRLTLESVQSQHVRVPRGTAANTPVNPTRHVARLEAP